MQTQIRDCSGAILPSLLDTYHIVQILYEPAHDKTQNQQNGVWAQQRQISPGIHPVWSESSWRKLGSLATHWAHNEDWSDWADAQVETSLGTRHFVGFVMRWLRYKNLGSL